MVDSDKGFEGCDKVALNAGNGSVETGEEEREEVGGIEKRGSLAERAKVEVSNLTFVRLGCLNVMVMVVVMVMVMVINNGTLWMAMADGITMDCCNHRRSFIRSVD